MAMTLGNKLPPELEEIASAIRFLDRINDTKVVERSLADCKKYLQQAEEAWANVKIAGDIKSARNEATRAVEKAHSEARRIVDEATSQIVAKEGALTNMEKSISTREQAAKDAERTNVQNREDNRAKEAALAKRQTQLDEFEKSLGQRSNELTARSNDLDTRENAFNEKLAKYRELAG